MGTIDDVGRMQSEGKSADEIQAALRQRGLQEGDIADAMAQAQIKGAVGGAALNQGVSQAGAAPQPGQMQQSMISQTLAPQGQPDLPISSEMSGNYQGEDLGQAPGAYEGMQPSMLGQNQGDNGTQEYGADPYTTGNGGNYPSYQSYGDAMSSDVISEVAEQVVSEKMASMHDMVERAVDFRTIAEARIGSLDNRLKRIEKILDVLQVSLLQKVGEYVNDVSDLKREMIENQKSMHAISKGYGHTITKKKKHP